MIYHDSTHFLQMYNYKHQKTEREFIIEETPVNVKKNSIAFAGSILLMFIVFYYLNLLFQKDVIFFSSLYILFGIFNLLRPFINLKKIYFNLTTRQIIKNNKVIGSLDDILRIHVYYSVGTDGEGDYTRSAYITYQNYDHLPFITASGNKEDVINFDVIMSELGDFIGAQVIRAPFK